jgi:lactoylglutathione lyase
MNKNGSQSNVKQAVPFFMVEDMQRSLRFYREGLGFTMTMKWEPEGRIEWCWLKLDDVALMLQEYRPGRLPSLKRGEGVCVCFMCEDALKMYSEITARGLSVIVEPFVGNAAWVVEVKDPDGYSILFESPATDVPEGMKYTEWTR